jgi:hypothetical protein
MAAGANDPSKSSNTDNSQLTDLLTSLQLLSPPGKTPTKTFDPGAEEVQVLKAGVTKITSWVSRILVAAGGAGAVWAAVEAYFNRSQPGLQIALVAAAAAIIGLAALALALVISADLSARAAGTAAQYQARGQVAAAYELRSGTGTPASQPAAADASASHPSDSQPTDAPAAKALASQPADPPTQATPATAWSGDLPISLLALATSGTQVRVRIRASDEEFYLTGVRYKSDSLKVRLTAGAAEPSDAGSWYDVSAIDEFDTTS